MSTTDCVGFLAADLPPVPPKRRPLSPLAELLAQALWPLADWKGDRAQCERAAQTVARLVVSINSTNAALQQAADEEAQRLAAELAGARATIDHMRGAMSWLSGHDRQGLDHLAEANYEARAREAAVAQARRWARRAWTAEAAVENVTAWCNRLDEIARVQGGPDAVHPVAANIRHHLVGATEEGPK